MVYVGALAHAAVMLPVGLCALRVRSAPWLLATLDLGGPWAVTGLVVSIALLAHAAEVALVALVARGPCLAMGPVARGRCRGYGHAQSQQAAAIFTGDVAKH